MCSRCLLCRTHLVSTNFFYLRILHHISLHLLPVIHHAIMYFFAYELRLTYDRVPGYPMIRPNPLRLGYHDYDENVRAQYTCELIAWRYLLYVVSELHIVTWPIKNQSLTVVQEIRRGIWTWLTNPPVCRADLLTFRTILIRFKQGPASSILDLEIVQYPANSLRLAFWLDYAPTPFNDGTFVDEKTQKLCHIFIWYIFLLMTDSRTLHSLNIGLTFLIAS